MSLVQKELGGNRFRAFRGRQDMQICMQIHFREGASQDNGLRLSSIAVRNYWVRNRLPIPEKLPVVGEIQGP